MTTILPPASILSDKAHMAICKAACDALALSKSGKRLPMFRKSDVQKKAGYPLFNGRKWDDLVLAIERFDWREVEVQRLDGARIFEIQYALRDKPLQLLGLTERAFGRTRHMVIYEDNLAGETDEKRVAVAAPVNPQKELRDLATSDWDDKARAIAGRFVAQNTGKKTAGYGSVEIANGRLAWRWLELVERQLGKRNQKVKAVTSCLSNAGLLSPPSPLTLAVSA